ncbi:hypothetical protein L1049_002581 [Liquidambar formosana]|uniref:Uncharacterized protein n=1 Tax=Liquidambar formosana TaxID=63359 RepID=A0AAP0NI51_LIQFO
MQEESSSSLPWVCPSFNVYSRDKLAEVAANVSDEFWRDSQASTDEPPPVQSSKDDDDGGGGGGDHYEDDFEFYLVRADPDATSVQAGEVFDDGQIRPVFPIFNRDLLLDDGHEKHESSHEVSSIGVPLKNLFIDERDVPSSSSSEADELERVPPGTYCFWSPKAVEESRGGCKKSKSTGSSSKRWRFKDLLRRSNSDGKDAFVFLTPSTTATPAKKREEKSDKTEKGENLKERRNSSEAKATGKVKPKGVAAGEKLSAHEVFYVRNRAMKEGDKRRSYLPYRQDLVGFFANMNGFGKNFPPF